MSPKAFIKEKSKPGSQLGPNSSEDPQWIVIDDVDLEENGEGDGCTPGEETLEEALKDVEGFSPEEEEHQEAPLPNGGDSDYGEEILASKEPSSDEDADVLRIYLTARDLDFGSDDEEKRSRKKKK